DQKIEQHDPIRPQHGGGQQNSVNRAGCANSGYGRITEGVICDDDHQSGPDSAEEVERQEAACAPGPFELAPEHPKSQHVPQDMADAAVEKHVGCGLPDEESLNYIHRNQREQGKKSRQLATTEEL